ncbi:glycosyltransferase [Aurantibacter sp.]|uniref:glycosyltransferase n=1 Tax=Aurantibacter sp. TaxID=2807103 RepID=UPI0035C86850
MYKKIILVCRGNINASPTIPNYFNAFKELGIKITCICSEKSVDYTNKEVNIIEIGRGYSSNFFKKLVNYFRFGKKADFYIKKYYDSETLVWVAKVDTAFCLGDNITKYKALLALHELHDAYPFWRKVTKKYIHNYKNIVMNEINRANIARVWYKLNKTPSIIPNKPKFHPRRLNIHIKNKELADKISQIKKNKDIILYQGSLLRDRNLEPLVNVSKRYKETHTLVIMGRDSDNRIQELKHINNDLVHISWVSPPDHLYITSHASIGVAFYDFDCLNSIYCAPNKIWEYSGYGIPTICQDVPGLINTIGHNEAGVCVDIDNEEQLYEGFKKIINNYKEFSEKSNVFYESVDFVKLTKKALERTLN